MRRTAALKAGGSQTPGLLPCRELTVVFIAVASKVAQLATCDGLYMLSPGNGIIRSG